MRFRPILTSNWFTGGHVVPSPHCLCPTSCFSLGGATPKRSTKIRRIHHLSWPPGSSVNDGIPDTEASIIYDGFLTAVRDLVASGPGSLLVKLDLEQAFRQIPVRPADWHLLGFSWRDQLYHDVVLAFGLRSAPYIFNLFAEALHWIIQRHIPAHICHYLDDFLSIFPPHLPRTTVSKALDLVPSSGGAARSSLSGFQGRRPIYVPRVFWASNLTL